VSRENEWRRAHRIAREIPGFSGRAKRLAISLLLTMLRDLLRSAGA